MFEGPPATMFASLDKLLTLDPNTLVWPGHEYAKDNLIFASHLEPGNENVQKKLDWVKEMRESNTPTCPSTLAEETLYNPFLRTSDTSLLMNIGMISGEDGESILSTSSISSEVRSRALGLIRERKDKFKYKL